MLAAPTYHLEVFDGPLDLLLSLIRKNKVEIADIPISLICDQYLAYLREAARMDLDLTSEFIVMASELLDIKSRMLLPRTDPEEEDPRAPLAEALLKYRQAKAGAAALALLYPLFSGRLVKDTDEIAVDRTFVADQTPAALLLAVRRLAAVREARPAADRRTFRPMIGTPIVPVETKIVGILRHFRSEESVSLQALLDDSVSLPDLIAIFLGVLELVRMRRLILLPDEDACGALPGLNARFVRGAGSPAGEPAGEVVPDAG